MDLLSVYERMNEKHANDPVARVLVCFKCFLAMNIIYKKKHTNIFALMIRAQVA